MPHSGIWACGKTTITLSPSEVLSILVPTVPSEQAPSIPGFLEGRYWRFRAVCSLVLSIFALSALIAIVAGNHSGWSRNLFQGILATSAVFVFLAILAPLRLKTTRRVELSMDGIAFCNFWRSWHFGWHEIAAVVVKKRNDDGQHVWYYPTVVLSDDSTRGISGLACYNNEAEAQRLATQLRAAVIKMNPNVAATRTMKVWNGPLPVPELDVDRDDAF